MIHPSRLLMAGLCTVFFLPAIPARAAATAVPLSGERRLSFNDGWRFFKGDAPGAERPDFQDAAVEPRSACPTTGPSRGPSIPRSIPTPARCRSPEPAGTARRFTLPDSAKDRYFSIEFDGAMSNAHVWLNGQELGGRPYGYIGFAFDLTPAPAVRQPGERAGGAADPRGPLFALVPGRGHLSQRLAGCHRPGVCRPLGHLHHHARSDGRQEHRGGQDRGAEPQRPAKRRMCCRPPSWTRRQAGEPRSATPPTFPPAASQTVETQARREPPATLGHRPPLSVLAGQRGDGRQQEGGGPLRHAVRHSHHRVRQSQGLPAERAAREATGRLRPLRPGRTGNGRQPPRHRAAVADPQGRGRQCHAHQPQSALARRCWNTATGWASWSWTRPSTCGGRQKVANDYHKYFDEWSERDVRDMVRRDRNHPSVIMCSIGNEIPEQGSPDGAADRQAPDRLLPPGGPHPADHLRIQQPGPGDPNELAGATWTFRASTTSPRNTSGS